MCDCARTHSHVSLYAFYRHVGAHVPALRVTKVTNLDNWRATRGRVQQDILEFEITVHDTLAVAVGNATNQLLEVKARLILDKFTCAADPVEELAAARKFHHLKWRVFSTRHATERTTFR